MKLYDTLLREFIKEQMGYATIAIIGQSCLGSVAAMFVLMNDLPVIALLSQLFLVTIFCMAYNGAVLAQLKAKHTFNLLILSVSYSLFTILVNSI